MTKITQFFSSNAVKIRTCS